MTISGDESINLKTVEDLEFYHSPLGTALRNSAESSDGLQLASVRTGWVRFETCQRLLFFRGTSLSKDSGSHSPNPVGVSADAQNFAGLELYRGEAAIEFLLEVLCGLKSRVLGETEIFGQFKHFVEETTANQSIQWNPELVRFLFETVKELRLQYISKWGVQSYGSMIRKFLKNESSVTLVGYGQLGHKLLPWLKGKKLNILVRDPSRLNRAEIEEAFGGDIQIMDLAQASLESSTSLVLAAPLANTEVLSYFAKSEKWISSWIDCRALDGEFRRSLREESSGFVMSGTLIELEQIFARIEEDQERARREKSALLEILSRKSRNFCLRSSHRPLGWDDLCA